MSQIFNEFANAVGRKRQIVSAFCQNCYFRVIMCSSYYNRANINFFDNTGLEDVLVLSSSQKVFGNFFRNLGRRSVPKKLLEVDYEEQGNHANINYELNEEALTS